jgi:TolA-binding protein
VAFIGLLPAQSDRGEQFLERGKGYFQAGNFEEAILQFREIIVDPDMESFHGEAYFWTARAYIALNQYDKAEKNLEFFLINYPDHPLYPESFYQKGRLLFLQKEYEKTIQILYNFIETFENNPYVANAYYWIGESLYSLGHLDDAETVFTHVVQEYPSSFKVEASKYRISIIQLKYREQELLKFLKWSHEEALKALEEYQIREKTYEQALAAYQKKLTEYAESGVEAKIEELTIDINEKEAEIDSLEETIASLKEQIAELNNQLGETKRQLAACREAGPDAVAVTAETGEIESIEKMKDLLSIKEEALELEEFYIDWLESNTENR